MWNLLRDLGTRLLRDLTGSSRERQELLAAQIRLNERETENAPSSVLRLWRSFLGWVLALLFCWEVPVRLLLLPLLLALVQGLLLWALWSLRRSFVPQAEHLRCRRDEQRREALWLRRLDLLEQALAQERELLTPLADEVRSLRKDAGRLRSQLQAQEARFYGLERLLQRLERHLERQEDRWQQLPGAALPALLHCRPPREVQ